MRPLERGGIARQKFGYFATYIRNLTEITWEGGTKIMGESNIEIL